MKTSTILLMPRQDLCLILLFLILASDDHAAASLLKGHQQPLGQQNADFQYTNSLPFAPCAEDFYKKFARNSKPVIFRNATKSWPAFKKWRNLELLKNVYGAEKFNVEFRKKFQNVFPVRRGWTLFKFLEEYKEKPIYLDSLFARNSEMAKDILLPPPLHCNNSNYIIENINLLMSSGGTSSAFHQDGYENLLSMISGVKEVILYDSKYTRLFQADNFTIAAGVSPIDPESVDLDKFPEMSKVSYYVAKLNPGDMLYIPQYWWHQVRSYQDPNIAVGVWFNIFNFDEELERRKIDEIEHVIQTTETFRELVKNEPLQIQCKSIVI